MPASSPSVSDPVGAFERLAKPIQRWIRKSGWHSLREIQQLAIPAVLDGGDVIIAAATASGKTEAAFLPLISRILSEPERPGFRIVYLSPLKSLINDQGIRLERLCQDVDIAVHKWHGDVAASAKKAARTTPSGILLITPESLEATLINRGSECARLFGGIDAFVIDELHAFIGTERGLQLLSLLHRIEIAIGHRIRRIGLSATLGDMGLAALALRPGAASDVRVCESKAATGQSVLDLQILTYEAETSDDQTRDEGVEAKAAINRAIAEFLFSTMRGNPNLIFANSRRDVEVFADLLRDTSESRGVVNEFLPHHGKLSKGLRESAETDIKNKKRPRTIVATSTLEMGVDIGAVECVAQIDACASVSSLRQRVGRSGRRQGQRPTLRLMVREQSPSAAGPLQSHLRIPLLQSVAVCRLLEQGWCEPPTPNGTHYSTLVHQILALIAQHAGRSAISLYRDLCLEGPFRTVTPRAFEAILRSMADPKRNLIEQASDGTLLLGRKGERRIEHFSFYAVFKTPDEYRIMADDTLLGTIEPDTHELTVGSSIIFAGRRWEITHLDNEAKLIKVTPSRAGRVATSNSDRLMHEQIGVTMRALYRSDEIPDFLDDHGRQMLIDARRTFAQADLDRNPVQKFGSGVELYAWTGTRQLGALALALMRQGLAVDLRWPVLFARETSKAAMNQVLQTLAQTPPPEREELRGLLSQAQLMAEKFDFAVPHVLLEEACLTERVDLSSITRVARTLLEPSA